jgi:hypothetical protein
LLGSSKGGRAIRSPTHHHATTRENSDFADDAEPAGNGFALTLAPARAFEEGTAAPDA